jgi:hypothetical protein
MIQENHHMKATRNSHQIVIRHGWGSAIMLPATPENMQAFSAIFKPEHTFKSLGYKEYVAGSGDDFVQAEIVPTETVEKWLAAGEATRAADEAKKKATEAANYLIENEEV